MKKHHFGLLAEYFVSLIYFFCFHRIVERRYKNFLGEIDIICKKGCEIIFIEVKARSSNIDNQYLSNKQKERIKRAALLFLQKHPQYASYNLRFDLVIVRPFKWPQIFKNAW